MTADLKPYPAMRDSGVPWLGEVPEHWEVRQLGRIGKISKGNGGTKEDEVPHGIPCVRYGDLYTQHRFFIERSRTCVTVERSSAYTRIKHGDVLFAASGETIEEIGKSAVNLIESEACCGGDVILFRPSITIDARFMGYATDCPQAAHQKSCMGRGITIMHIYGDFLKHMWVALPPLPEQSAIARFLDHMDRRIECAIRAKQKLIALLNEQKQAIIHQAVTRGLDPNVRLKPSSVDWLGDVPEHWMVVALRHRYSQCLGKMLDAKRILGVHPIPYLRNTDVQWDRINTQDLPEMDIAPNEYERYTVRSGDLLVCEGGEVGRCAIWRGDLGKYGFQKAIHRLRPLSVKRDLPRFLFYILRMATTAGAFEDGHESTIAHLTGDKLRAHRFPFPDQREQAEIVAYLDQKTGGLECARIVTSHEIALLREYRARLIADVVTGKLDVREAAARLPEEAEEPEPLDEDDALECGGEEAAKAELDAALEEATA